jgi:hypothetical protein
MGETASMTVKWNWRKHLKIQERRKLDELDKRRAEAKRTLADIADEINTIRSRVTGRLIYREKHYGEAAKAK